MARNKGEILPASVYGKGELGLEGLCLGVPVILGYNGVRKILELELWPVTRAKLNEGRQDGKPR